ncbi:MAG: homocysteine S-methyltransferase family protein, partial [Dehalococcoidia bacterium]
MPSRSIVDRINAGEVLVLDGGTGSEIQRRGVSVDKGASAESLGVWSAAANLDAPDVVRQIHEDYLNAGAEIVTSNNFYTSRPRLAKIGEEHRWEEYTHRGG